ncbi:inosine 5'-monophosphate dehydrogenase [Symmachiella dynata]|uniref:Inosine 5'-monophosphate dehydrogenase n=1 Tax=Symmachiella dynata TaxID=2527995 RepID=A0A517ZLX5_9PLAN|nr:CBS domain-containing protein [Symmachiella dynata]QDU43483.1 inosine 5'-monophosphate dehydrogenase [Symmachiella dynata]
MTELPGRLGRLAARDIMTSKLVILRDDEPISTAAATLKEHGITGAPVIDQYNSPIGMLSLSDIIQTVLPEDVETARPAPEVLCGDAAHTWELFEHVADNIETAGDEVVSQRMSRLLVTVADNTPLVEVARVMCDGHWHRVAVVDESGNLCGIVSTMDVLAAMINAADEGS